DGLSKKLDFRDLPDALVTQLMHRRNNIPRKSLTYRPTLEVFLTHVTEDNIQLFSNLN
ncbi:IS30 family transposase, partial [Limosilactobacillus reuteri]